jgi:hypothetical protein
MTAHELTSKRHILPGDAEIATLDPAIFDEPTRHERRRSDADGKADSLGRENHCRIHADHLAA